LNVAAPLPAYGITEVYLTHDYYASLRVKLLRLDESGNYILLKDNGDHLKDTSVFEPKGKVYDAPENFVTAKLETKLFYVYEDGEHSIPRYKYILHRGTSRSSKTWSLCEWSIRKCESRPSTRINVWRDTRQSLGDSIWSDFKKIFPLSGRDYVFPKNTVPIYFENGSTLEPHGADTTNAHGITQDIAWLNEPYRVSGETFNQIDQRSEQVIIDMNPVEKHFTDKLEKHPRCKVIHSTFMRNPFCPPEQKRKILSYDPSNPVNIANQTADAYLWAVYGLGIKAERPNKILRAWNKIPNDEFKDLPYSSYFGLDFGTTNPSSLSEIKYGDGAFFVKKRLYAPINQMANGLSYTLKGIGITEKDIIIADPAQKDDRLDLIRNGFNVIPAQKPGGSVLSGINTMNKYPVYYVEDEDIEFEHDNYEWEVINGVNLERPIKKNDHFLNATMYGMVWICKYLSLK
jgi:phage terminase large subunit